MSPMPFKIAIVPDLKGEGRGFAAALIHGPLVSASGRVRFDRVGLAKGNIDVSAIRLPSWLSGCKVFIGIGDAPVMLFAEFVFGRVGIGVAAQPELLDEGVPLLIVAQTA